MKLTKTFTTFVQNNLALTISIGFLILTSILLPVILIPPNYDDVIEIKSDEDFLKYDFISGNGTFDFPYLIESRRITNPNSQFGISIENTTAFFIIRNCQIDVYCCGISLENNAPNTAIVEHNEITVTSYGAIHLAYTNGVLIRNNLASDCFWGILVYNSESINIHNNEFENTTVEINFSDNCSFWNNMIRDYRSVTFRDITNITVTNNMFIEGKRYIDLKNNKNLVFVNNTIEKQGISLDAHYISDFESYIISNNTVSNLPIGFFINQYNTTIDSSYGQLIIYNCSNFIVKNQLIISISYSIKYHNCLNLSFYNITIYSGEIHGYTSPYTSFDKVNIHTGRLLLVNSMNSSVENSFVSNYAVACVELVNCPDSKFENNVVTNSSNQYSFCVRCCVSHGVTFTNSQRTSLINNSFINSGLAVAISEIATYTIHNNSVDGKPLELIEDETNLVISEQFGQVFLINCENITIINQEMTAPIIAINAWKCNNTLIQDSSFTRYKSAICQRITAISILSCSNVTIQNCYFQYRGKIAAVRSSSNVSLISNVIENSDRGFDFWDSSSSLISDNNILNCESVGRVHNSNDSIITNNNFVNLTFGGYRSYEGYNLTISFNLFEAIGNNVDELIHLNYVFNSSIIGNFISSAEEGIILGDSSGNIIANNTIHSSTSYGISIYSNSHFNQIYYNNFIDNNLDGVSQAFDENSDNLWYNTSFLIGNYWNDLGTEITYLIVGSYGIEDIYPVSIPF